MNGRAPKGGTTIAGIFYNGGQFLPSNNEPKRGMFNTKYSNKISTLKRQASMELKQALGCHFDGNKIGAEMSYTMATVSIRKMKYFESK